MNLFRTNDSQNYKRILCIILLVVVRLFTNDAKACDICGCFMGITPYDNQSSVGLIHRFRSFNGYTGQDHSIIPSGAKYLPVKNQRNAPITSHNGSQSDFEVYRASEIRGRYFFSRKIEFNAIVPYASNTERYNGNVSTVAGLGDVNVYAGYHIIRKLDQKKFNQRLIIGSGIKLPTGKSDAVNFQGIKYNTLSQTGTGSTDGFVYINYMLGYKKAGLSLNSTYKFNGENKDGISIANSTTDFLNFFYKVPLSKKVQIVPSVQFAYEYSAGEKYQGVKTGDHVMNNLMSGLGLDLFYKNITLNMAVQGTSWSAADDHPLPAGRLVLGLTYNFNQLYYLLN